MKHILGSEQANSWRQEAESLSNLVEKERKKWEVTISRFAVFA